MDSQPSQPPQSDPSLSSASHSAPPPATSEAASASEAAERFRLPSASRSSVYSPPVEAASSGAVVGVVPGVLEREAKARLLALRRIEWVAISLVAVLLGGAAWSWRSQSDSNEARRAAFNGSPVPFGEERPGGRGGGRYGGRNTLPAWREARPAEVKAASLAIMSQLDAFKRDDFAAAAKWQSESLKRNFSSLSNFRRMIKEQYPDFASYKSVRFGRARTRDEAPNNAPGILPGGAPNESSRTGSLLEIEATLRGPQDNPIRALYLLVREGGAYRIAGVQTNSPSAPPPEDSAPPTPPADAV